MSGCVIGDGERDYAMSHITPTDARASVGTPATIPITPPSLYWIKIDPISDKQVGENFTINSTTNISVDTYIQIQVYSTHFKPTELGESGNFSGCAEPVKTVPGRNGINTISFIVNSSTCRLIPDEYQITEDAIYLDSNGRVKSNAIDIARFNITPRETS